MLINDIDIKRGEQNKPKLFDFLFPSRNISSCLITNHKWIKTGLSWFYFPFLIRTTNFAPLSKPKLTNKPQSKEIKELFPHLQYFLPPNPIMITP